MRESTFASYLLYSFTLFCIIEIQINNTLILADNNYTSIKEDTIKSTKIMTKNREYLISSYLLKFNNTQIKLNSNGIILIKESYIGRIFLVTDYVVNFTGFKGIIKKKLLSKK